MEQILNKLIWKNKDPSMFSQSNLPFLMGDEQQDGPETEKWDEATLVTSRLRYTKERPDNHNTHYVVLDLDMPAILMPSSTVNHYHLIIQSTISWDEYKVLLETLASIGVIEQGYADASINRGYSAIRRPGVTKAMTPSKKDLEKTQRSLDQTER